MNAAHVDDGGAVRRARARGERVAHRERLGDRRGLALGAHRPRGGAERLGALEEDLLDAGGPRPQHRHGRRPDDGGLLGGDRLEGVAEDGGVVEADAGDRGDAGRHDAGGVPAAAETDLEDGDLDAALAEEPERGRGEQLELGEAGRGADGVVAAQLARGRERGAEREREVVVADDRAADLDALGIALQLGARVEAGRDALAAAAAPR